MPRKKKTMKKYLITLPENQVGSIDVYAVASDLDRSVVISSMLDRALSSEEIMDEFLPSKDDAVKGVETMFRILRENKMKDALDLMGSKDELVKKIRETPTSVGHKSIQSIGKDEKLLKLLRSLR